MTKLEQDDLGYPIQVGHPARAQNIDVIASSRIVANAFGGIVTVVELIPATDMHIKFGSSVVAATQQDPFLAGGIVYTYGVGETAGVRHTHIAAILATSGSAAKLRITELE